MDDITVAPILPLYTESGIDTVVRNSEKTNSAQSINGQNSAPNPGGT
jgi:hypothetical protein